MSKRKFESIANKHNLALPGCLVSSVSRSLHEASDGIKNTIALAKKALETRKYEKLYSDLHRQSAELTKSGLSAISSIKKGDAPDVETDKRRFQIEMAHYFESLVDIAREVIEVRSISLAVLGETLALMKPMLFACRVHRKELAASNENLVFILRIVRQAQERLSQGGYSEQSHQQTDKSLFKNGIHILSRLVRAGQSALSTEAIDLLTKTVSNVKWDTLFNMVDFLSSVLQDTSDTNVFMTLKDFVLEVDFDSSFFIETVLSNCPRLIVLIVKSASNFIEVLKELAGVESGEAFAMKIRSLHSFSMLERSGIEMGSLSRERLSGLYKHLHLEKRENMINHFVAISTFNEGLFIMNSLMTCKRKTYFKRLLEKYGLQSLFEPCFDYFFDERIDPPEAVDGDISNIELIRIQFLRLCMNYTDADVLAKSNSDFITEDDRLQMLAAIKPFLTKPMQEPELKELMFFYDKKAQPVESRLDAALVASNFHLFKTENLHLNPKSGILLRLLDKLFKTESRNSCMFWMCSLFESFIRGLNPYLQVFFAVSGLLWYLTKNQIEFSSSDSPIKKNVVQIYYDLIGEMVKYNQFTLCVLLQTVDALSSQNQFHELLSSNLLDSNVLMRSVILTDFYLRTIGKPYSNINFEETFVSKFRDSLKTINRKLMVLVTPSTIYFENLCCLNTIFVIIITQGYLNKDVKDYDPFELLFDTEAHVPDSIETLRTYRQVLQIWDYYYTSKTRELFKLEHSTCLKMQNLFAVKQEIVKKIDNFELMMSRKTSADNDSLNNTNISVSRP